jgi:hypothetical protein
MRERAAMEFLLWRITFKLRRRTSWSRRREIRAELRQQLRDSAAVHGMDEAMRRLGHPSQIARDYLAMEPEHPNTLDVGGAAIAAGLTLMLIAVLNGRRLYSLNGLGERYDFDPWSFTIGAPNGSLDLIRVFGDLERDLVLVIQIDQLAYVLLPVLVFAVFLRPWRRLRGGGDTSHARRAME